jgi:hypothetical protein
MKCDYTNDDAAAGIFTFVLLFILCGILFLMIGYGVDRIILLAMSLFADGTFASQYRFDTVNLMLEIFRIEPLIVLFGIGINFWVSEGRLNSGMADTGTMIIAAAELLTMTLILVVFCLYGGYAFDSLVYYINHTTFPSPDLSMFGAVQYISPVFYGMMLLILIGVVVQFLMTCVRVVDYNQYQTTYGYQ